MRVDVRLNVVVYRLLESKVEMTLTRDGYEAKLCLSYVQGGSRVRWGISGSGRE